MIRKMMANALRRAADAVAPDETDWTEVAKWLVGLAAILGAEVGAIYLRQHHERITALERREKRGEDESESHERRIDELRERLNAIDGTLTRIGAIAASVAGNRMPS